MKIRQETLLLDGKKETDVLYCTVLQKKIIRKKMEDVMLKRLAGLLLVLSMVFALGGCMDTTPKADPIEIPQDKGEAAELFINEIAQGEYETARTMLAPELYDYLPAKHIKKSWNQLTESFGNYQEHELGYYKGEGEQEAVYVKTAFENETLGFRLVFNEENKVISFTVGVYTEPPVLTDNEEKVTLKSGIYNLDAVLTMPEETDTLPPAVVLVGGSGPTDLDSTVGPNKPFAQLAHGLAERGVAAFRYDKRTLVYGASTTSESGKFTVYDEYVEDAKAAVAQLAASGKVDSKRIYIAAHSMGGMMVPMMAENIPDAAGFVMISANARRLEDLILYQNEYLLGINDKYTDKQRKAALKDIEAIVKDVKEAVPDGTGSFFNGSEYYWYDLNQYDQVEKAKEIKVPLLVLQGESDYQVPMEDFEVWKEALAGKENVTLKSYPKMNHLLMESNGMMSPDEYIEEGTVLPELIDDIANFVK